jgi:16S rRNA (cytosine1402-N4)-methyltransferase
MTDRSEVEGRGKQACHVPVMVGETKKFLITPRSEVIVDATIGLGGHAEAILEAAPLNCVLVGIDLDDDALSFTAKRLERFGERVVLKKMNYGDLAEGLPPRFAGGVDGLLVDCGISGLQIVTSDRGFSFDREGDLDMRFDRLGGTTAGALLGTIDLDGLTALLREFGEGRLARKIARSILDARDGAGLRSTLDLSRAVKAVVKQKPAKSLARVFLAMRATVNAELESLTKLMNSLPELIRDGGRVCVITYHSLEDRIVKQSLRRFSGRCVCPPKMPVCSCGKVPVFKTLTPKPVTPQPEEVKENVSARSAKLRAAEKIG